MRQTGLEQATNLTRAGYLFRSENLAQRSLLAAKDKDDDETKLAINILIFYKLALEFTIIYSNIGIYSF